MRVHGGFRLHFLHCTPRARVLGYAKFAFNLTKRRPLPGLLRLRNDITACERLGFQPCVSLSTDPRKKTRPSCEYMAVSAYISYIAHHGPACWDTQCGKPRRSH